MAAVLGSTGVRFEGLQGVLYDVYIKSPLLSGVLGRLQWGSGGRAMRAQMERAVRSVPADATVVDVPCGGGILLRWLEPGFSGRWPMLRRYRRHRHFRRHAKVNVHLTRS